MSGQSRPRMVILWAHEIRIAAKALDKVRKRPRSPDAIVDAVRACGVALYGAERDGAILLLTDAPKPTHKAREVRK